MTGNLRSSSYSIKEDEYLCHQYMDVSQNPITGIYQSRDTFWTRIEQQYNEKLPVDDPTIQPRNKKSLQNRMSMMMAAVIKLRGYLTQVENLNPSGTNEADYMHRAKVMLAQDKNYKKGFKFDHVWLLLKDTEKFSNNINPATTFLQRQGENIGSPTPDSPGSEDHMCSPTFGGIPSFNVNLNEETVNLNEENFGSPSTQRPMGIKKSKLKRKVDEDNSKFMEFIKDENRKLDQRLQKGSDERQHIYDLEMKKLAMAERQEENKILSLDLSTVANPHTRAYLESEQTRIVQKRVEHQSSRLQGIPGSFSQFFGDIGGSGTDLDDY